MDPRRESADVETSSDGLRASLLRAGGRVVPGRTGARSRSTLLAPWPRAPASSTSAAATASSRAPWWTPATRHGLRQRSSVPCSGSRPWVDAGRRALRVGRSAARCRSPTARSTSCSRSGCFPTSRTWPRSWPSCAASPARAVVVDYPTRRSVNAARRRRSSPPRSASKATRGPSAVFRDAEIEEAFGAAGLRASPHAGRSSSSPWPCTARWAAAASRAALEAVAARARPHVGAGLAGDPARGATWLSTQVRLGASALPPLGAEAAEARRDRDAPRADGGPALPRPRLRQRRRQPAAAPRAAGRWASADLTEEAVASIRGLVATDVHLVDGGRLPFADAEFDRVVVVDMLEHAADEDAFVAELARITRRGGARWS